MPEALRQVAFHAGWMQGSNQPGSGAAAGHERPAMSVGLASSELQ